jgi:uncharacterized protein
MTAHLLTALWLLLAPLAAAAADLVPLPTLAARVTDLTATLTAEQRTALEASMAAIEREKGSQLAILVLPTTQPETIEEFGIRLAEAWQIGRDGIDDGVIVIVAKDDRKMRIEVGYGLEGAIPDAVAKRIVADVMGPRFREGDFAGGLNEAVTALGKLIGGEALPAPPGAEEFPNVNLDNGFWLLVILFFAGILRSILGVIGSLLAGGLAAVAAWWVFGSWLITDRSGDRVHFLFARPGGGGWAAAVSRRGQFVVRRRGLFRRRGRLWRRRRVGELVT